MTTPRASVPVLRAALDRRTYTADYDEIKDLGRATDTSRTAEQSATALFWSPSASALWSANVRSLASTMDLLTAARFEAIGLAAVTNSLIACWDAKYTYMFWRPVTAIRAGDTDGNSETEPDRGVDTLHHHAIPPGISRRAHHGRRRRPRLLHGVVRDR